MKSIIDSFTAAGEPVSNKDFIMYILGGIGKEYNLVEVLITSQASGLEPSDALASLMAYESRLEQRDGIEATEAHIQFSVNYAKKGHTRRKTLVITQVSTLMVTITTLE